MKLKSALKEFKRHVGQSGVTELPPRPVDGAAHMLSFYTDVRASDVDLQSDGDMLLFQWGTFDWGDGPMFEFDITRQLIGPAAEDDDIWQLHLTYLFTPSGALSALGNGDRWCSHPNDLVDFQQFIETNPATTAVGLRTDGRVRLRYECAG